MTCSHVTASEIVCAVSAFNFILGNCVTFFCLYAVECRSSVLCVLHSIFMLPLPWQLLTCFCNKVMCKKKFGESFTYCFPFGMLMLCIVLFVYYVSAVIIKKMFCIVFLSW